MPTEVELKLSVSPRALRDAARLPWLRKLAGGPVSRETLTSVYFDTDKFKLRNHGLTLRIRKLGRKRLQTIKADSGSNASGREEWEEEVSGDKPDLKRAKRTALKPLITRKLKRSLRPVFETEVRRIAVPLRIGESELEVAFDRGAIRDGRARTSVSEIELELKNGDRRHLARVAERFRKAIPVAYGVRSKAERGYALSMGEEDQPVAATSIALAPTATVAEAFTAIGLSCLHHLAANEGAVRRGDSEGVHQMRVGLRRLRAAISIFKDVLQDSETEGIKRQLEWSSRGLGPARDFDVLVEEGVAPLRRATQNKPEMTLLEADLKKRRDEGFKQAKAAVATRRYQRIVLDTALWLIDGEWLRGTSASSVAQRDRPIEEFAWDVIRKRTRKIVKKSREIETLDARRRHKLRIAAKKLRYATGFFVNVLDGAKKPPKRFEKELKTLQNTLGKLNDIAVHQKFVRQYARAKSRSSKRPQKAFAAGVLTGREQASTRTCLAAAIKAGKGLAKAERHWL